MRLVLADEAQKRERDALTWEAWGQRLTVEQYACREQRLRSHPWTRAGMETWLLQSEDGSTLASCETFRMRSRLPGASAWGSTFAVASVFTEPRLRARGYCSELMRRLVGTLRERGAHASILFSDVGPEIYQRSGGYLARPAIDRVFDSERCDASAAVDRLIREADLEEALAAARPPESGFVVWPSAAQLDWHLERERAYAELLGRPRPVACGARAGASSAFWAADIKNDRLVVLLLDARRAAEALALIQAAKGLAAEAGLRQVLLWETPGLFDGASTNAGATLARDGGLPMLSPLAPGVRAEDWSFIPRALWV